MDSLTMGGFISQKDEIDRLNNQINMIADFYHKLYKGEIKSLKVRLVNKSKSASNYKAKWRMETSQHETQTDKARRLINTCKSQGLSESITSMCANIAKEVSLSVGAVRTLWYVKS